MGKLDLFLLGEFFFLYTTIVLYTIITDLIRQGILHVAFGSMPHLPEDAKVTAFAQVIWPDPKASCIKFIDGEYELYDSVLSNGFDVIDNTPNANEHILSALKRYDHLRREYSFYIGELDGNYVIYRDVYQGKKLQMKCGNYFYELGVVEPNKYECADLRPISELPKLSTEPNLETEVFTQEQAIATTPKPLLRTTATLSPRPTGKKQSLMLRLKITTKLHTL